MTIEAFLKKVGSRIAKLRKEKSLTQKAVAEEAHISYRYYQRIESGIANLRMSTLYRIARLFGAHPTDLLPGKSEIQL